MTREQTEAKIEEYIELALVYWDDGSPYNTARLLRQAADEAEKFGAYKLSMLTQGK